MNLIDLRTILQQIKQEHEADGDIVVTSYDTCSHLIYLNEKLLKILIDLTSEKGNGIKCICYEKYNPKGQS